NLPPSELFWSHGRTAVRGSCRLKDRTSMRVSATLAIVAVAAVGVSAQRPASGAPPPPAPAGQQAPAAPAGPGPGQPPAPQPSPRIFGSETGLIFNAIKPDKAIDFEMVLERLRQALAESTDPDRKAQAAGWKVFKAVEPGPSGSVLYVFVMNPAVKGA